MSESNFTPGEVDGFISKLNDWGSTLSGREQELLKFVIGQAQRTGALSDDVIARIVGGLAKPPSWTNWLEAGPVWVKSGSNL